jgi:DtxR family Mn-dependent transcriptional regulator
MVRLILIGKAGMAKSVQLSASLEDYLEAIFTVAAEKGAARAKDIARRLDVKAGSVTGALQALAEKKLVNYAPYEVITLTSEGLQKARQIIRRHEVLRDFFVDVLGVDEEIADEGACKLEHDIPKVIFERLIDFVENYKKEQIMTDSHSETTLAQMQPGRKGTVLRIAQRGAVSKRLAEMGIGRGTLVEVERVAPLGDPIDIKVRGYHLSLRKEEAAAIVLATE